MSSKRLKKQSPKFSLLSTVENWFHNSATIFVARTTAAAGFVTAVMGGLDWSPLLGMSGLDRKQVIVMGAVVVLIGVSHEIARRRTLDA